MSARRLSLHPSALSDVEYTLFTVSLGDLLDLDANDSGIDWERLSLSVREARAWLCGRYVSLGSATVDEILRLFPAPTLSGGAFFAALRLVLHAQAGRGVERSLAFVQAPVPAVPIANPTTYNPFLPTPAPSPEFHPRKPILPARSSTVRASPSSTNSESASNAYSSSASPLASGLASYQNNLGSDTASAPPPMHPLRRASTQREAASSPVFARSSQMENAHMNTTLTVNTTATASLKRTPSNPFRKPPLPPRRASTLPASPQSATSEPSPTAQFVTANTHTHAHARTAPPTRSAFFPPPPPMPSPHNNSNSNAAAAFNAHGRAQTQPQAYAHPSPFDSNMIQVQPATPTSPYSPFDSSASPYAMGAPRVYPQTAGPRASTFASAPPVHPQRRASASEGAGMDAFGAVYGEESASTSRRVSSDSASARSGPPGSYAYHAPPSTRSSAGSSSSSSSSSTSHYGGSGGGGGGGGALPLPLTLPKALRRTLAGAGWVGAERGEREGLVRGSGSGSETAERQRGVYTARNARRGEEAWGEM
ncbi:hypothetical protein C8F04DRAFT_1302278 [Mycena alexandri]|uniref:Uncharacterized protein n=1 Tax=Mycena alexandri TaxID=1745969 RepID=A0AAD6TAE1_9AGAR|nr:hypothetical protein C8F04DRAFT_1302278 [Mycena alexandri]